MAHFALEHSGDEVFLLDAEARFVYVNDSMCATLGLARERLLGMAVPDIDPVFPPQQLPEVFARLREESSIRVETVHQRSDGTRFPVEVVSNYFVVDGVEFNCCIGRDITERVAAERALEASREYLDTLFRLHEVIEEVLALVAGCIVERGVEVVVHEAPVWVQGDRPRLTEVFLNLLDNAVKFMGEQPAPRIEIGVEREDEALVVVVADNGKGIDPRHLHKIFGLFERLDREGDGTGIGLTLVQRIVEVHGGRIWAESPGPGLGARFCFTLGALELRPDG